MVSEKTNGEDRDCFSIASADCCLKVRLNIYVEDLPLLAELRNIVQPDTELTVFDIPSRSTSGSSDDDPEITASSTERFGLRWRCQVRSGSGRTCHRKTLEKAQPRTELGRCRDTTLRLRRRQTGAALPANPEYENVHRFGLASTGESISPGGLSRQTLIQNRRRTVSSI
jgi:hypothetical protein